MSKCDNCGCVLPVGTGDCPLCTTVRDDSAINATVVESATGSVPAASGSMAATGAAGTSDSSELGSRYEILEVLGQGAMGKVEKARDRRLDRLVAIKRILTGKEGTAGFFDRFMREALALAKFRHPNIVSVLDVGQDSLGAYIIMEFVEGRSLEQLVRRDGKFPALRALGITRQLLSALATLHKAGIVHRDIKPLNIVLCDTPEGESPVLLDFGLAMDRTHGALTVHGDVMGTPHYMAPEQWTDSGGVDARADLYSTGATLYRMLTGRAPLEIEDDLLSDEVRPFVMRLVERVRKKRHQSAREALDDLTQVEARCRAAGQVDPTPSLAVSAPVTPFGAPAAASVAPGPAAATTTPEPSATGPSTAADASVAIAAALVREGDQCAGCGANLGASSLRCTACGDGGEYCSDRCFDGHEAGEHCAECFARLVERFVVSAVLNAAVGRELRFCGSPCRQTHQERALCQACSRVLAAQFVSADAIDRVVGREVRLCSKACAARFRLEELCAACSQLLPERRFTCGICQSGERFCSEPCHEVHRAKHA